MKKYKTVKVYKEELTIVICDFCGKKFDETVVECRGFGQIKIDFGYPSNYDGDVYKAEICDDCFLKLFKDKLRLTYNYISGERNESFYQERSANSTRFRKDSSR